MLRRAFLKLFPGLAVLGVAEPPELENGWLDKTMGMVAGHRVITRGTFVRTYYELGRKIRTTEVWRDGIVVRNTTDGYPLTERDKERIIAHFRGYLPRKGV